MPKSKPVSAKMIAMTPAVLNELMSDCALNQLTARVVAFTRAG
jgi:hypothetical protein